MSDLGQAVGGLAMWMGLYEAAFATLAGIYGRAACGPITGITLIAGFASTLKWPPSGLILGHLGLARGLTGMGAEPHLPRVAA